jgi:hypothetical protein
MANFDQMKLAVEGISGGKNTIILDDVGMPSYMVRIPQLKYSDVITGGTQEVLDAFIVDGAAQEVLYIGKYQNTVVNGRAYSLPFKDPTSIVNFDTARAYCRAKGAGWHLQTNALWAAIALWCKKNGTLPHGNNYFGQDIEYPYEKGIPSMERDTEGRVQRTATGSGPSTWYHDYNSATGIADMNGNVWEWCGGLRLQNGEIQVIPYGNAMKDVYSGENDIQSPSSTLWQAIIPDGTFVAPGTSGTLKWDYTAAPSGGTANFQLISGALAYPQSEESSYGVKAFETLTAGESVAAVPQRLKGLALFPADSSGYQSDHFWFRNINERIPFRGGAWGYGGTTGVFALYLNDPRWDVYPGIGFRVAFFGQL